MLEILEVAWRQVFVKVDVKQLLNNAGHSRTALHDAWGSQLESKSGAAN